MRGSLETIGAISDSAGAALATEELLTPLVQSLIEKYELYEDLHPMMTHIFEALSSVCAAAGMNMQSIAQGLFQRAMRVLEAVIIANSTKVQSALWWHLAAARVLLTSVHLCVAADGRLGG